MECMVYARQRWGEITSKKYKSAGGNFTAQDLYDNWTGNKGYNLPDNDLPALAMWESNQSAGHTAIVESKNGSNYFCSDHSGWNGYNVYGSFTGSESEIQDAFNGFIGFCW